MVSVNSEQNTQYALMTDEELFTLIRSEQNEVAFNTLYSRYSKRLYAYCLRATGSREGAQDAFQVVMNIIFEKRETFTGGSFAAWLFTIARHHVLKVGKLAKRVVSLDEHSENTGVWYKDEISADNTELHSSDFLLRERLDSALATLSEDLRSAFLLKYHHGFQHEEIADQLGISVSLAKVRVFRAKQQLRNILASVIEEY